MHAEHDEVEGPGGEELLQLGLATVRVLHFEAEEHRDAVMSRGDRADLVDVVAHVLERHPPVLARARACGDMVGDRDLREAGRDGRPHAVLHAPRAVGPHRVHVVVAGEGGAGAPAARPFAGRHSSSGRPPARCLSHTTTAAPRKATTPAMTHPVTDDPWL